jgi:hypothetical protein
LNSFGKYFKIRRLHKKGGYVKKLFSAKNNSGKFLVALMLPVLSVLAFMAVPAQDTSAASGPYVHFRNNCSHSMQASANWNRTSVGVIIGKKSTKSVRVPQSTVITTRIGGIYPKTHYLPTMYSSVTRTVCG